MTRDYNLTAGTLRISNYGSNFDVYFFTDNNECDFQFSVFHDELIDYTCEENIDDLIDKFCEKYFDVKSKALSEEDIKTLKKTLEIYVYPHSNDLFERG